MSSETIPEYSERVNSRISSFNIEYIIIKLEIIIDQLDIHFANAKNLILEIARELDEGKLCKQSQICRKIKELLEDKIKAGKLSEKWIELLFLFVRVPLSGLLKSINLMFLLFFFC